MLMLYVYLLVHVYDIKSEYILATPILSVSNLHAGLYPVP